MAGLDPEARGTTHQGTENRGTAPRDVIIDTGLGPMTVAAVILDKPPAPFHTRLESWVPDAVRSEIQTLEEAGLFDKSKLLAKPKGRFLKRYPSKDGAVVVWIGVAHNVELHVYREFPEAFEFYMEYTRGDAYTARMLCETYTRFNRDLWHFVNDLGMRPDFARGELNYIDEQVFKMVLEMAGMLLSQGASLAAVRATSNKILEIRKQGRESSSGLKPKKLGVNKRENVVQFGKKITTKEEALFKKLIGGEEYKKHLDALEEIRKLSSELEQLSDAEIMAIRAYSHNTYDPINRAMRHGGVTPEIRLFIDKIQSGLQKLPAIEGSLERGISLAARDAEKLFVKGKQYVDKAFQSATSGSPPVDSSLIMIIKAVGKNGRDISKIAAHDEKEVLFLPNTHFRIDNVTYDGAGNVRLVNLTEL